MNKSFALVWICLGVLGRLIPHPPNATPLMATTLFTSSKFSGFYSVLIVCLSLFISDLFLAQIHGTSIFGMWSLFTYSGFIITAFAARLLLKKESSLRLLGVTVSGSLFFWVWTNFGHWLTTATYAKNFTGLVACYTAAIPFLRNALLADLIWAGVLFGTFAWAGKFIFGRTQNA